MLTTGDRDRLIEQYAAGPARLRAALGGTPVAGVDWRPGPGEWSTHEVVCHCADTEMIAAARIKVLLVEPDPLVVGFDQDAWAARLDYHRQSIEQALAVVDAVRAYTTSVLRRVPPEGWARAGRHTESGLYTAEKWLETYARHLDDHARQIEANGEAWARQASPARA